MTTQIDTETRDDTRKNERGATLVEYGLVVALFVLVLTGAGQLLTDNAGDLLNETGADIAADPPPRDVVQDLPVTPPVSFPPPTVPSSLLTYVDKPIELFDGTCLSGASLTVATTACGDPSEALITSLSEDGSTVTLDVGGLCLVANTAAVPATLTAGACTSADAIWVQDTTSGTTVVYRHQNSGQCLTAVSPPAPELFTLAGCDGRPEQTLIVRY